MTTVMQSQRGKSRVLPVILSIAKNLSKYYYRKVLVEVWYAKANGRQSNKH